MSATDGGYMHLPGWFYPNPPTVALLLSVCERCGAYVSTLDTGRHDEWHGAVDPPTPQDRSTSQPQTAEQGRSGVPYPPGRERPANRVTGGPDD